jgi:hypothetical protein
VTLCDGAIEQSATKEAQSYKKNLILKTYDLFEVSTNGIIHESLPANILRQAFIFYATNNFFRKL